jgi:hypothetical protein
MARLDSSDRRYIHSTGWRIGWRMSLRRVGFLACARFNGSDAGEGTNPATLASVRIARDPCDRSPAKRAAEVGIGRMPATPSARSGTTPARSRMPLLKVPLHGIVLIVLTRVASDVGNVIDTTVLLRGGRVFALAT